MKCLNTWKNTLGFQVSMHSRISLSEQESILYFYIKEHGWTSQKDLVLYRGKDNRQTRKLLQGLETKGILKSKYVGIIGSNKVPYEKYYKLKH